jgi:hypothetical protein
MAELLRERIRRERLESGAAASSLGGMDQEMEDLLLDVGIVNPVTKESAGSLYHRQLSRQLADWLIAVLERRGGVMAAPEIYCLFNRARGTELVSPEDLIQVNALSHPSPFVHPHVTIKQRQNGHLARQFIMTENPCVPPLCRPAAFGPSLVFLCAWTALPAAY